MVSATATALLAPLVAVVVPAGATTPAPAPPTGPYVLPDATIDTLRTAVEGLATVDGALATGRSELGVCVDRTGHYFANTDKISDGLLDSTDPEALVYADVDGSRRLVAVAWVSLAPAQVEGVPLHLDDNLGAWVLHAWVGLDNPAGTLADRNPLVGACDQTVTTDVEPSDVARPTTEPAGAAGLRSGAPPVTADELPTGVFELPPDTIEGLRATFAGVDAAALAAAGWPPTGQCVEGTGWIFTDRATTFDGALDPARPEVLVYTDVDGATRLAAVGWASSAPAQVLGVPLHPQGDIWELYAWIGLENPAGMLADRHPAVAPCAVGLGGPGGVDGPTASESSGVPTTPPVTDPTTSVPSSTTTTEAPATETSMGTTTSESPTTTAPSGFPFTVSATTVSFGAVPVGTTAGKFINVTNTGNVPRQIAIAHEPTGALFPVDSNCSGMIDPGVSCRVSYSFAPTRPRAPFSTTTSFRLACCGGQTRDFTITLRGESVEPIPTNAGPTSPPAVDPDGGPVDSLGG